jgi:hypothetical protein
MVDVMVLFLCNMVAVIAGGGWLFVGGVHVAVDGCVDGE